MYNILASETGAGNHAVLDIPPWHWAIFIAYVAVLITIDMVFHRKDHEATLKSAAVQTLAWIGVGIATGFAIWGIYGADGGAEYFSGYVIEKSLSIDNVFVWSVILTYFAIPRKYQHRVLFWGIFGALVMRAIFILAGIALIEAFEPTLLVLGAFLLFTGYKVGFSEEESFDPETSKGIGFIKRVIPVSNELDGHKLVTHRFGKREFTMLFVALCAVELTDVLFAVDSVPAILAVARDPFIVFASNAMAILGLRALYFVFDAIKDKFEYLSKGLGIILIGVGVKMIVSVTFTVPVLDWHREGMHVNTWLSLCFIILALMISIIASLLHGEPVEDSDKEEEVSIEAN